MSLSATLVIGGFVALNHTPFAAKPTAPAPAALQPNFIARPLLMESAAWSNGKADKIEVAEFKPGPEQWQVLHPTDRVATVSASLRIAARQSADHAVREAIRFCDEDPSYSLEYGRALISTLASKGEYRAALRFVLAEDTEGWLEENGSKWLTSLFNTWAKEAPQQALQTVEWMVPLGQRSEALQTIAAVWAQADPAAFDRFIRQRPTTAERQQLLRTTLLAWSAGQRLETLGR